LSATFRTGENKAFYQAFFLEVLKSPIDRGFVNIGEMVVNVLNTEGISTLLFKEVDNLLSQSRKSFSHI